MIERYVFTCKHCNTQTEHDHIHNVDRDTGKHVEGSERYTCRECDCSIYAQEATDRKLPIHFDLQGPG